MTPPLDMFDRKDVLRAIETEWFGARGTSRVLLCPQKVGKSYLLEHIYLQKDRPDLIFCRINQDMLWAERPPTDKQLDQTFLKYFLRQLHAELETWVEDRAEEEKGWRDRLEQIVQQLAALAGGGDAEAAERRRVLEESSRAFKSHLHELETLRRVTKQIEELLALPVKEPEDLISRVGSQLDRLGRLQKRIVLIIDDYHRIVAERAFSDTVFHFLRACNSAKTIITLASSPMHLMDESLHGGNRERSSLFNHVQPQFLRPFKNTEADQFLEWLSGDDVILSTDAKAYLRELGGGSPYFLRQAWEQFVRVGQPPAGEERQEMEREVGKSLEGAFRDIWQRCSARRRAVLREVGQGKAGTTRTQDVQELLDDGYIVDTGTGLQLFSRLFPAFVTQQPEEDAYEDVLASAVVSHKVFPTALTFAKPDAPLVTFQLANPTSSKVDVRLSCKLEGYSDENSRLVKLAPGERQSVDLAVVLQNEPVRALTNPRYATVRFSAELLIKNERRLLEDRAERLRVLPVDNFTFARKDESRNRLVDFTWLIAAWVRKPDPALEDIRSAARETLRATGGELSGYPEDGDLTKVQSQVAALYEALRKHGLDYDNSALVYHHDHAEFVQRVRLPAQVLKEKAGNCLEGCVVFASLLANSDLHPLILFLPGHAIVGWRKRSQDPAEWFFLETTVISTDPFEVACQKGQAKFEEHKDLCLEWEARAQKPGPMEIRNPQRFAILVDIPHVWKTMEVVHLPG